MLPIKSCGHRKPSELVFIGGVSSDWVLPSLERNFSYTALHFRQIAIVMLFVRRWESSCPLPGLLCYLASSQDWQRRWELLPHSSFASVGLCCALLLQIKAFFPLLVIEFSLFISLLYAIIYLFLCIWSPILNKHTQSDLRHTFVMCDSKACSCRQSYFGVSFAYSTSGNWRGTHMLLGCSDCLLFCRKSG